MKNLKIALIAASLFLLAGCTMDESTAKKDVAKPIPQNCNQWCHNGWCSTHCEAVVQS